MSPYNTSQRNNSIAIVPTVLIKVFCRYLSISYGTSKVPCRYVNIF
jgi:hypothetical protein